MPWLHGRGRRFSLHTPYANELQGFVGGDQNSNTRCKSVPERVADACAGLSTGHSIGIPVKGYPQPQGALVLDSGGGKLSVCVMCMGEAAGKKLTLACSAVRR